MTMPTVFYLLPLSVLIFVAVFLLISFGYPAAVAFVHRQQRWYERVLVQQLLIDIHPHTAVALSGGAVLMTGLVAYLFVGGYLWFFIGAAIGAVLPYAVVRHLESKRRHQLERQLVDSITTVASGVRAGLNIVQSMEMLEQNSRAPIKQEFAQLLREYQMGLDLDQAMRNAANRIGSSHFRLLFTALEMHRRRGGDVGQSLDRIAESIREIQRLEGKLETLTASGRFQAVSLAGMPIVLMAAMYLFTPGFLRPLTVDPIGRIIMVVIIALVVTAFFWIRKIMNVDI